VYSGVHLSRFVIYLVSNPIAFASLTPPNHVSTELQKDDYRAWFLDGRAFVDREGMKQNQISPLASEAGISQWQRDAEHSRDTEDGNCVTAI
jgi:hypothetical protein